METKNDIMKAFLRVIMPNGEKWDVPVSEIAKHRAKHCKDEPEFGGDYTVSLEKGTIPFFEKNTWAPGFWAACYMNWEMVKPFANHISTIPVDYQDGLMNGEKEIVWHSAEKDNVSDEVD